MAKVVGSVPNLVQRSEREGNPPPPYEGSGQQVEELDKVEVNDA